jgi:hypothetical protein
MKRTLLLAAALMVAGAVSAQQYKWTDKNGRVQYGDAPPPGVKATPLRPPPGPASQPPAAAKGRLAPSEQEAQFRKRQQELSKEREKLEKAAAEADAKKENCARAQADLRMLEAGGRIARTDSKGERYYLDDAQIAQETGKARDIVKQWCN